MRQWVCTRSFGTAHRTIDNPCSSLHCQRPPRMRLNWTWRMALLYTISHNFPSSLHFSSFVNLANQDKREAQARLNGSLLARVARWRSASASDVEEEERSSNTNRAPFCLLIFQCTTSIPSFFPNIEQIVGLLTHS